MKHLLALLLCCIVLNAFASQQCHGTTKTGNRCRNMTNNASGYCYLHVDQAGSLQQQKSNSQNSKPTSKSNQAYSSPSNSNYSVADEIRKLKKLLDEGIITQEEFENQKKKLLAQ